MEPYTLKTLKETIGKERFDLLAMTCSALYWSIQYDDSNPDVGMGPSIEMLLDGVLKQTEVKLDKLEYKVVIDSMRKYKR